MRARERALTFAKNVKPGLFAITLALSVPLLAREVPTIVRATPNALRHISNSYTHLSESGCKYISLQIATGTGGTTSDGAGKSISYMLEFESLIIGGDEKEPQTMPIAIRISGMNLRVSREVLDRLRTATIDVVQIQSTDGAIDQSVLMLRPSEPIAITRCEHPVNGEQAGAVQPATRPESKPEGGKKPQPEAEGRSR